MTARIAISAGHNYKAKGAVWEGFSEWPETRIWAELVMQLLSKRHRVMLVPEDGLTQKVAVVNQFAADIAIEIHFNGGGSASTNGCETLYAPGSYEGERLARLVQDELVPVMGNTDRGIKEGWLRQDRPGVVDFPGDVDGDEKLLYFLKATKCPAIIVEPEFVQQYKSIEAKRLAGAQAIARGILLWAEGSPKGIMPVNVEEAEAEIAKIDRDEVEAKELDRVARVEARAEEKSQRRREKRKGADDSPETPVPPIF